jgi:FdhD protein
MECTSNLETVEKAVTRVKGSDSEVVNEPIVVEKALTVYLNNEEFVTMVCSPNQEKELVIGFFCSEGIITNLEQLKNLIIMNKEDGLVWVETNGKNTLGKDLFLKRHLSSCCGKGRSSFYFANDAILTRKVESALQITSEDVSHYTNLLEERSELFRRTGGVHGGALASDGQLEYFAADIGRHNVLDKLYGHGFLTAINFSQRVVVFSGRISSEIVIKTGKMGCLS